MLSRVLPLFFLVLGVTVANGREADKKADTHEGKLVKVDGNKIVMSDKEGKNEHSHTLAADAKITCDGKECKAADLKPGVAVKVTTKAGDKTTAVRVEASTK
jgi:hypothetical protein